MPTINSAVEVAARVGAGPGYHLTSCYTDPLVVDETVPRTPGNVDYWGSGS